MTKKMAQIYKESMAIQGRGYALYEGHPASKLRTGLCGYFDAEGDWVTIVDLANPEAVKEAGFGDGAKIDSTKETIDTGERWGPHCSVHVKGLSVGGELKGPTGSPVSGSGTLEFTSKSGSGAVLVTDRPMSHHIIPLDFDSLNNWVETHKYGLIDHPHHSHGIKAHGLWIVTKTWTCKRRAIGVILTESKSSEGSISVEYESIATAKVHVNWWERGGSAGWSVYSNESGVVVYVQGVYYQTNYFNTKLVPTDNEHTIIANSFCKGLADSHPQTKSQEKLPYDEVSKNPDVIRVEVNEGEGWELSPSLIGEVN